MPNPRFTPPFTESQQKFLALCPKFTSIPSIIGSVYILQHVLRSPQRRQRIFTRLLLGMCSMDLIYGIKTFVSTWPLPASTNAYGAVGTTQTCTAAGFWGQGGSLASALYNGSLALYYLLTIRNGWTQSRFHQQTPKYLPFYQWEVLLHLIPLSIGWGTAIASLPLKLMNPIGWTCWIGPWPMTCETIPGQPCVRGANAKIYRWVFFHAILWATFAFVAISMLLIFLKIRADETSSKKYRYSQPKRQSSFTPSMKSLFGRSETTTTQPPGSDDLLSTGNDRPRRQKLSRRFAEQACFYIIAFFLAWIWPMAQFAVTNSPSGTLYYPMLALTVIINPLQGAFNALIYIRPRYLRYRQKQQQRQAANNSDEGSSGKLGIPFISGGSGQWQALVSAISVVGDDDEDDWEATEGRDKQQRRETPSSEDSAEQGGEEPDSGAMKEFPPSQNGDHDETEL